MYKILYLGYLKVFIFDHKGSNKFSYLETPIVGFMFFQKNLIIYS